jgi:hypothetical protein
VGRPEGLRWHSGPPVQYRVRSEVTKPPSAGRDRRGNPVPAARRRPALRQITIPGGNLRPTLQPGPIRPVFRILGLVVGPVLLAAGALMILLDTRGVTAAGWPVWSHRLHAGLWLGLGNVIMGWLILRVARSGHDPYVIVDEEASPPRPELP